MRDLGFEEIAAAPPRLWPASPAVVLPPLAEGADYFVTGNQGRFVYRLVSATARGYQFTSPKGALFLDARTVATWYAAGRIAPATLDG